VIFSKVGIIRFTALNLQNLEFLSKADVAYLSSDSLQECSTVSAYEVAASALIMCCNFNSENIREIFCLAT